METRRKRINCLKINASNKVNFLLIYACSLYMQGVITCIGGFASII